MLQVQHAAAVTPLATNPILRHGVWWTTDSHTTSAAPHRILMNGKKSECVRVIDPMSFHCAPPPPRSIQSSSKQVQQSLSEPS